MLDMHAGDPGALMIRRVVIQPRLKVRQAAATIALNLEIVPMVVFVHALPIRRKIEFVVAVGCDDILVVVLVVLQIVLVIDRMMPWSSGWQSLVALGGKKMMRRD